MLIFVRHLFSSCLFAATVCAEQVVVLLAVAINDVTNEKSSEKAAQLNSELDLIKEVQIQLMNLSRFIGATPFTSVLFYIVFAHA